ncbi:MAG: PD-(D/E)XK nuclease family protein, partial [Anaerolineae bacterium]|nr:PD-(D/E)XK nuclease family protein [Anaerolineae bacterium]
GPEVLENPNEEPQGKFDGWSLQIPACIRALGDDRQTEHLLNRDAQTLNLFKDLLRGMLEAQDFLETTLGEERGLISWTSFHAELVAGVKNTAPKLRSPMRSGRVLLVTAAEARGLPHEIVYVLGLAEGIFPAERAEDPLYLDSERRGLREYGVFLETLSERSDDNGICYELISLPRKRLVLSRPYVREGKPWVESHLWRMSRAVFTDIPLVHYGIGEVVAADDVASLDEAVVAVADGLSQPQPPDEALKLYQWLTTDDACGELWQSIWHGREVEAMRLSTQPFDGYSGLIQHPDLLAFVRERLDERRLWSASQLNEYGVCPYRFFAKRLLKLEALEEPQEGLNALQLGLVNHKILEATYGVLRDDGMAITPENFREAKQILHEQAQAVFKEAPLHYQFRASALWEQEKAVLLRQLEALIAQDFSSDSPLNKISKEPRIPYALELKFGFVDSPNVRIAVTDSEAIRVRGSIDRVDRAGDQLIVVDYKTGSTGIPISEMKAGRNFQMAVYLLALEEIIRKEGWPYQIAGGLFWHIRNQKASGQVTVESEVGFVDEIQDARMHLARHLQRARSGDFSVQPSKVTDGRCTRYCEFSQLCRLASTNQYKVSS